MSAKVVGVLNRAGLDAIRVENPARPGTPDVNYLHGWIENKWARHWPVRPGTKLAVDHFTPQQRVWLLRRSRAGGRVHLLLKVGETWMLFEGSVAARLLGHATKEELLQAAVKVWPRGLREMELVACLIP